MKTSNYQRFFSQSPYSCFFCRGYVQLLGSGVIFALSLLAIPAPDAFGQGCVSTRCPAHLSPAELGIPGIGPIEPLDLQGKFQTSIGYRWFRSDRHFVGDEEQKHRQDEGSEVINISNFIDLATTYFFNSRTSASLVVPFSIHDRSSTVRTPRDANGDRKILERYHTQAGGLGDLRLSVNHWLIDPVSQSKGNVMLSMGVDAPTGKKDASDTHRRYNVTTGRVESYERNVDQSIQPGDGGWGIPLDLYGYYSLNDRTSAYLVASYLITPEEKNGVQTGRSNPFESVMSVADTFAGRAGLTYVLLPDKGVAVSLGLRAEGVPVRDLVGGSEGFRRPGIAVSVEPGVTWMKDDWFASLTMPIAVYRNRFRSVPDRMSTNATGVYRHGDAAFADFLVVFTVGKSW